MMNIKSVRIFRLIVSITVLLIMVLFVIYTNKSLVLRTADAEKGFKELSDWDVQKEIYALDGEWKFYPGEFTGSEESAESPLYIEIPSAMIRSKDEKIKSADFGTFEVTLDLNKAGNYMLMVPRITSAYRLYVNGEYLGGIGQVGKSANEERGVNRPGNYFLGTDSNELDIKIEVSNYTCVNGGIIDDIYLGTVENIYRYSIDQLIKDMLVVGILVGLGIYPLLMVIRGNEGKAGYYFAGFSIASAIFAVMINPNIGGFRVWDVPLKLAIKVEFMAYVVLMICIYLFLISIYPYEKKRDLSKYIVYFDIAYLILVVFTNNLGMLKVVGNLYSLILVINAVVCLYVIGRSFSKRRVYALISFMGSLVFVILGLIEIVVSESNGDSRLYLKNDLYNIGLIFFLICHINIFLMDIDEAFENAALADRMEISYLHAQIAPHFLFNTLNNLYVLMSMDLDKAKDLLMNLSEFLKVKYKFDYKKFDDYKLGNEVEFLKSYTNIENYRKDGKIRLEFDFDGEKISDENNGDGEDKWYESVKFEPMILQPLVENAIRHGFKSEPLLISIHVKRVDGYLDFMVEDNGAGMPEIKVKMLNKAVSHGVGITNINYRLSKYCGERLHFESEQGHGTRISFRYRMEEAR